MKFNKKLSTLPPTAEQEKKLLKEIAEGNPDARYKMILSNLGLVISRANKYKNKGIYWNDLVQAGNIGLVKAVDKFNIKYENKFSTYACPWIDGEIKELFRKQAILSLPNRISNKLQQYKKIINNYRKKNQSEPSDSYIAEKLGLSEDKILELKSYTFTITNMEDIDKLPDNSTEEEPLEGCFFNKKEAQECLQLFTDRERLVMDLRWGLTTGVEHTLREIGKILNMSAAGILKIEKRFVKKTKKRIEEKSKNNNK